MAPIDARKKLEQIKRKKNRNKSEANVKDLRQLIAKKKKTTTRRNERTTERVVGGRVTKSSGVRDLRDANRKLAARKVVTKTRDIRIPSRPAQGPSRPSTNAQYSVVATGKPPTNNGRFKATYRQPIRYYVPPHMQQQQLQQQQPTYIIAPAAPRSNLAMDNEPQALGASILISNLIPSITQSDIIELFGEIGVMTAVNMINQTTALVTYQNSSDAVKAVKLYHNRELDGKPMFVNMMPNSTPSSNVRSRIGRSSMSTSQAVPMQIVLE